MKKITLFFIVFFGVVAFMNAQHTEPKSYFNDHYIGGLADNGDVIWVGVDNLLVKMDKVTGETITSYTIPISSEYNYTDRYASSISLDNSGLLWITSPNGIDGFGLKGDYLITFNGVKSWMEI